MDPHKKTLCSVVTGSASSRRALLTSRSVEADTRSGSHERRGDPGSQSGDGLHQRSSPPQTGSPGATDGSPGEQVVKRRGHPTVSDSDDDESGSSGRPAAPAAAVAAALQSQPGGTAPGAAAASGPSATQGGVAVAGLAALSSRAAAVQTEAAAAGAAALQMGTAPCAAPGSGAAAAASGPAPMQRAPAAAGDLQSRSGGAASGPAAAGGPVALQGAPAAAGPFLHVGTIPSAALAPIPADSAGSAAWLMGATASVSAAAAEALQSAGAGIAAQPAVQAQSAVTRAAVRPGSMPAAGEGTQQGEVAEEQAGLGSQNPLGDTGASMQASCHVQPARDSRTTVGGQSAAQQTDAGAGRVSSGAWLGPLVAPLAQAASRQQEVPAKVLSWLEQSPGALQSEAAPQHSQQAPSPPAGASPWPQQLSGPPALPALQTYRGTAAAAVEDHPADPARASLEEGETATAAMDLVPTQPAQAGLQGTPALHSASVPACGPSAWPTGTAAGPAAAAADVQGGKMFVIPDRCLCLLVRCCLSCRVLVQSL